MAGYEALRPEILANEIMTDRERVSVFRKLCYQGPMLGEIKKMGDVVRIPGVGRPTVNDYSGAPITWEQKQASQQLLYIDQAKYVAVMIDEVDDKQAQMKVINKEIQEAKRALAQTVDEFLAGMYASAGTTITNSACVSTNILSTLTEAEKALLENDVPAGEDIHLVVSPAVYEKMKLAKIVFQQTNKEAFGKGYMGSYLNFNVHVSNSVQENGDVDYCMAFTNQAIAFAEQIPASNIKILELEDYFGQAFKVLNLYGGKVIRPSELVQIAITPDEEAAI